MFNLFFPKMILYLQQSCSNWQYSKLGMKKCFPFWLIFFHQLALRERIFGMGTSLFHYFLFGCISNALHQVMFQETYSLSFWWLLIEQTQYQNIDMIFEEIFLQGANLHNFRSVVKIGPSPRWNLVPNCYFRKIFNVIFRTIYPHKEYLFVHDWFFSWFSTEI